MVFNPQDRYETPMETRKLETGQTVYRSLRPKTILPNPTVDPQISATDATRMDVLAQTLYGNASMWWKIAAANGQTNGSLYFRPGSRIILPSR